MSAPRPTEQRRARDHFKLEDTPHHLGRQSRQVQLRGVLRRGRRGFLAIVLPGFDSGGGLGCIALVRKAIFFFVVASSSSSGGRVEGEASSGGEASTPGVGRGD